MRSRLFGSMAALVVLASPLLFAQDVMPKAKKVLFLGDSITHGGQYIVFFETELRLREPKRQIEILNLGLPSETVSGLSEAGHAGGRFPRPDLHERLDRVLDKTKPDLIVACYGMNDAIYLPLDEGRFQKYKDGLVRLREKADKAGAKIIHLTPPVFDTVPIRGRLVAADKVDSNHPYEKYDEVLDRYSDWLLDQRKNGWQVIDIHNPMKQALAKARETNPKFTFAGDGVHPNLDGQLTIGRALVTGLNPAWAVEDPSLGTVKDAKSKRGQLFNLVDARSRVLRDAWLSHTGHKRPLGAGLPLEKAQSKAAETTKAIDMLLK